MFKDEDAFMAWLYELAAAFPEPSRSAGRAAEWLAGLKPEGERKTAAALAAWLASGEWPDVDEATQMGIHLRLMCAYLFLAEGWAHGHPLPLKEEEVREVLGQLAIELWSEGQADLLGNYDRVMQRDGWQPGCN